MKLWTLWISDSIPQIPVSMICQGNWCFLIGFSCIGYAKDVLPKRIRQHWGIAELTWKDGIVKPHLVREKMWWLPSHFLGNFLRRQWSSIWTLWIELPFVQKCLMPPTPFDSNLLGLRAFIEPVQAWEMVTQHKKTTEVIITRWLGPLFMASS